MKTVAQLLRLKPPGVVSVPIGAHVLEALKVLAEHNVGAVVVMDGTHLAGMFSERDYARKVALEGRSAVDTPVSDVMTRHVHCVTPTDTNEDCMSLMTRKRIRHLPVLHNKQVIGVLSIGDLVKDAISEQQAVISELERYIHG
jgi:CBS domain-containing protein